MQYCSQWIIIVTVLVFLFCYGYPRMVTVMTIFKTRIDVNNSHLRVYPSPSCWCCFAVRYDDQKFRLLRSPGSTRIIVLIEGSEEEFKFYTNGGMHDRSLNINHIQGALEHAQFISGFSILHSDSIIQT